MYKRRKILSTVTGGAVAAILAPRSGSTQELSQEDVFRDPDAPVLGNPDGDTTVVEFFDYQCAYCKRSHEDVKSVIADDGNVRLVMKDWPVFGNASVFAAQAVLGASTIGYYEKAMEALMATPASLSEDDVKRLLTAVGLDLTEIADAVRQNNRKINDLLTRNYKQALAFRFAGTPSFVIGKKTYSGVLDSDQLRDAIREARAV